MKKQVKTQVALAVEGIHGFNPDADCVAIVVAAVKAEQQSNNRWIKAADALHGAGLTRLMLRGDEEREIKPDAAVVDIVNQIISFAFDPAHAALIAKKGTDLRVLTLDERARRTYWINRRSAMVSRICAYLRELEEPGAKKRAKKEAAKVAEAAVYDFRTRAGVLAGLDAMLALLNTGWLPLERKDRMENALRQAHAEAFAAPRPA